MYCKLSALFLFLFSFHIAEGQQLNLGAHFNPAITAVLLSETSKYDEELRVPALRLGYNIGLNIGYTSGKVNIESGLNYVGKSIAFRTKNRPETGGYNSFRVAYFSHSVELPFLLSYNIHRHDWNDIVYDLYLTAGLSYERSQYHGSSWTFSARNTNDSVSIYANPIDEEVAGMENQWMNFIFGFKINTVIRGFGLIDYGLTWHIPFSESKPYMLNSKVTDYNSNTTYALAGEFAPRMSYIDIKLCYYFLNYDRTLHRIRHKEGGYMFY